MTMSPPALEIRKFASIHTIVGLIFTLFPVSIVLYIFVPNEITSTLIFLTTSLLSIWALISKNPTLLISVLLVTGALQRILQAALSNQSILLLDDFVLAVMLIYIFLWSTKELFSNPIVNLFVLGILLLLGYSLYRSVDFFLGLYQIRQIIVPAILLAFGFTLNLQQVKKIGPLVVLLGVASAVVSLPELFGFYAVNPNLYSGFGSAVVETQSNSPLPGFYYYHFENDITFQRLGSVFLNPPSFGIYAASAFLWARFTSNQRSKTLNIGINSILTFAIFFSFSRAGILIWFIALIQPKLTKIAGKYFFGIVASLIGLVSLNSLLTHGASYRHFDGALSGIDIALSNPLGIGLGYVGNRASLLFPATSEASESFATIFLAATGWLGLIVLLLVLRMGINHGETLAGAAITSAILVSLFTETISGLDAASTFWLLVGIAINSLRNPLRGRSG